MSDEYVSRTYNSSISPEERQRRQMNAAINAAIQKANSQHQKEMADLRRKHENERQKIYKTIDSLNGQIKDSALQHQQQLDKIREEHDMQLQQAIAEIEQRRKADRERFEQQIDDAVEFVNANIEDLRKSTLNAIDTTNTNLLNLRNETRDALHKQQEQLHSIANEVHNDKAKVLAIKKALITKYKCNSSIIKLKNHLKYAPNQLDTINATLNDIDSLPDIAACAILHTALNELSTLEYNIEQAEKEFVARYDITLKAADQVLAIMNENKNSLTFTDGNNNELRNDDGEIIKIDLDLWTEGEYGKLEERLKALKDSIINGIDAPNYNIKDLDSALLEIGNINKQQNNLVLESIRRGNASLLRKETADIIIDLMEEQRFYVTERGYENNDKRNAYFIKFKDSASELVIVINPENDENNRVIRKTIDTNLSEQDIIQLNQDIDRILYSYGFDVSEGRCRKHNFVSDEAWKKIYDMDVVQQSIPFETKERAGLNGI